MTRLLALAALTLAACASTPRPPGETGREADEGGRVTLTDQASGTDARLIGSHAVDADVVWLSGTDGTVVRTVDGGATWTASTVPGADTLQLRDVEALDARTAWALSIGTGAASRIFKTTDGGASWRTVFVNREAEGFFDCLTFWDARQGLAFSDSIEDGLLVVATADGGETWARVPPRALPAATDGEGGFAASGTCVTARPPGLAWIATGNATPARVLRTADRGVTWTAAAVPVVSGPAAGLTSVVFRTDRVGVALGGDISRPDSLADTVARTEDGGVTWARGGRLPFGAGYGAAYVPGTDALVAVGPGGAALSRDDGRTWSLLDDREFWGVTAASREAVWLVGPEGRVVRLRLGAQ